MTTRPRDRARPLALWVTPVTNLAGVARHLLDVAPVGVPGWDLVFACPAGTLAEALRERGARVELVELGEGVATGTAVARLRELVRRLKPQLVHTHLARADLLAAAALVGLPPSLVSTEHGIAADDRLYNPHPVKAALKRTVHRARVRRVDAIIGVSESTTSLVRQKWQGGQKVVTVLNGIDAAPAAPALPGHRFLSLSRLAHEKNIDQVLAAFALVVDRLPQARLTVAGDGPLRDQLHQQATRLGLGEAVTFPGHVDADAALASHDVVVQLSAWENASYTLLDAAARRMGVVATPVGGNPEFLPARCLVEAADTTQVAAAMLEQASQPTQRPSLPPHWPSVAQMCDQIAEVYLHV